jgi:hypothetical protein
MVRRHRRRSAILLGLSLLPIVAAGQDREWSPAERAVIGDFSQVNAVAVSRDRVYAVTPTAVLEWDPQSRRWSGPWQPHEPGRLQRIAGALADPLDGSLWLVESGGWLRFDPLLELWEAGSVPGGVLDAALDESAPATGLYLRTRSGWYLAQRGGIAIPGGAPQHPQRMATVEDAIRSNPAIRATGAMVAVQGRFREVRFTSAARAQGFTGQGWFLGTRGAGLLFYPEAAGGPEPLLFGLPSSRVAAVYAGNGGVWAVTERTPTADPGLSFVGTDLGEFRWVQGPRATGLPFVAVRRMVGRGSELWVATDGGVVQVTPSDEVVTRFDQGRGLPDSRVLDLAQRRGRIAAATRHGVALYDDSTGFVRLAPRFADLALSVELSGDTIWVGTEFGLFAALPGEPDLLQPDALREGLSLQAAVVDLAWRGDTLVGLTRDRLLWRDPATGRFTLGPLLGNALGALHTLVNGPTGLYLAGERGVGFTTLTAPMRRPFTAPGDLPGRVSDLAVGENVLWVATEAGLVRLAPGLVGQ